MAQACDVAGIILRALGSKAEAESSGDQKAVRDNERLIRKGMDQVESLLRATRCTK
jgi:hypothetical protein